MKTLRVILTATLLALALATPALAQSLWGNPGSDSLLFSDRKARNVGDVLTIVIAESATTSMNKSTSNSKSGEVSLNAGMGVFDFLKAASAGSSDSFKADGSTANSNRASGRIAVTVTDVMPNGNMVVEGTQSIYQGKNEHKISLRGIVRRDDVSYMNTVPSTQVADASIKFDGKGPINAKQRQGILSQIFNILF